MGGRDHQHRPCSRLSHRLFFTARQAHNKLYGADVILLPKTFFFVFEKNKQERKNNPLCLPTPPKETWSVFPTLIEFSSLYGLCGTLTLSLLTFNPKEPLTLSEHGALPAFYIHRSSYNYLLRQLC